MKIFVDYGEPVMGAGWCDTCMLQTVFTVPILGLSEDGVTQLAEYSACSECEVPA